MEKFKTRKDELDERKTVTMFVFNNFTNDTRVLREAKSLNELGLEGRIIALLSSGQKTNDEIDGIEVTRLQLSFPSPHSQAMVLKVHS